MKRLVTSVTLALLLVGLVAASAGADDGGHRTGKSASGLDDGRRSFGLQPAGPHGPDARAFYSYSVTPGAVVTDRLAVLNISDRPATLTVYAADAFNSPGGGFDVAAQGVDNQGVGSWLRLRGQDAPLQIRVPARSNVLLPVLMRVPRDAAPGDHAGGIVASFRTLASSGDGSSVAVDERVGVRVYTRVSGALRPHLSIANLTADFHGGAAGTHGDVVASWTVRNTGNVILGGRTQVRVSGLATAITGPRLDALPALLPGESHRVTARVSDVPRALRLGVTATVRPGSLQGVLDPRLPTDSATTHVWAVPWLLVGIVLFALGLAALAWWLLRRRRSRFGDGADIDVPLEGTVIRLPARDDDRGGSRRPAMRRLVAAGALAAAAGLPFTAVPSAAAAGQVTFLPGTGLDVTPTYLVTPAPCPVSATNVVAVATGHGFPAGGQVVVTNSMSPVSHDAPMVIHLQDTFNGFAAVNSTKLSGDYRVTVRCIDHLQQHTYATWSGTITFQDGRHFTAAEPTQATRDAVIAAEPGASPAPGGGSGQATGDTGQGSEGGSGATGQGADTPSARPNTASPSGGASADAGAGEPSDEASTAADAPPGADAASTPSALTAASGAEHATGTGPSWLLPAALLGALVFAALTVALVRRERAGR